MSKICGLLSTGAALLHTDRHASGLDYMSRVDGEDGTWYSWLKSMQGVYELKLLETSLQDDCEKSKLAIRYYPSVEEDVFESFACREQLLRVSDLFDDGPVEIPENPDVCPCCGGDMHDEEHESHHCHGHRAMRAKGIPKLVLRKQVPVDAFVIGTMECVIKDKLESIKINSQNYYREYVAEGIKLPDAQGQLVELVAPNGLDRNVPGLELTKIFAEFFITKFLNAFSIVCIPEKQEEVAGVVKHCLRDNQLQETKAADVKLVMQTYKC